MYATNYDDESKASRKKDTSIRRFVFTSDPPSGCIKVCILSTVAEAFFIDALDARVLDLVGVRDRHAGGHDPHGLVGHVVALRRRGQQVPLQRSCAKGAGDDALHA